MRKPAGEISPAVFWFKGNDKLTNSNLSFQELLSYCIMETEGELFYERMVTRNVTYGYGD